MMKRYTVRRAKDPPDGWELVKNGEGQSVFFATEEAAKGAARTKNRQTALPVDRPKNNPMWK